MKTTKPLLRFRVYVNPKERKTSPFYWCTIWRTVPQARQRMRELTPHPDNSIETAVGACFSYTVKDYLASGAMITVESLKPEMGEIVLNMTYCGSSTIAHECSHAAFSYTDRVREYGIHDDEKPEERHCLTVGFMTRQIVMRILAYTKRTSPTR